MWHYRISKQPPVIYVSPGNPIKIVAKMCGSRGFGHALSAALRDERKFRRDQPLQARGQYPSPYRDGGDACGPVAVGIEQPADPWLHGQGTGGKTAIQPSLLCIWAGQNPH